MTIQEDYRRSADECERLAATCLSDENRAMLLLAAAQWRRMAKTPALGLASGIVDNGAERRRFS